MTKGKVIYTGFKDRMILTSFPKNPKKPNFVIQWRGMDWSGFRTLEECEKQFDELNPKDDYRVIEV